jgi:hypothetical protein
MTYDLLAKRINPQHVKELLQDTNECSPKKIRIYDDPGEIARARNKMKRMETNKRFSDEYFSQFHSKINYHEFLKKQLVSLP